MADSKKNKRWREMKWIEATNDRLLKENEKKWEEEERMIAIDKRSQHKYRDTHHWVRVYWLLTLFCSAAPQAPIVLFIC